MTFRLCLAVLLGATFAAAQTPAELQAFRLEYRVNFDPQSAAILGPELALNVVNGVVEVRQQIILDAPAKRITVRTFLVGAGTSPNTSLRDAQISEMENYRIDLRRIETNPRSLVFEGVIAPDPRVFLAPVLTGDPLSIRVSWYGVTNPVFDEVLFGFVSRTVRVPGGVGQFQFSRTPNRPPSAVIAPAPQTLFQPELQLDASASQDPDGDALDYRWRAVRGSVSIAGADTPTPRVQFHSGSGQYELMLTVTDARGAAAEASIVTAFYGR